MMISDVKRAYWQQHFENCQQSQLPQREYCQQHNLSYASFGYWRTRLNRTKASSSKLVPVADEQISKRLKDALGGCRT